MVVPSSNKGNDQHDYRSLGLIGVSFCSTECLYHVVVNKKTSRSGISSADELLVNCSFNER